MARRRRGDHNGEELADEERELNLAPIMNLVIILIPMLLLSVVFLSVGVIDVSTPRLIVPGSSGATEEEGLGLSVHIGVDGIEVATREGGALPAVGGCPADGPTVCLRSGQLSPADAFAEARRLQDAGRLEEAQRALDRAVATYRFHELYNTLAQLKAQHPEETTLKVSADADIPYAAVVRVMDTARYRLQAERYGDVRSFWRAGYAHDGRRPEAMFPHPVVALAR